MWASRRAEQSGALLSQLRWMSDSAEIPTLIVHARPIHTEVHQVQFLHLMWCFLMYSWRILHRKTSLTIKTQKQESHSHIRVTVHLHKGLFSSNKAEQLLCGYPDIPHISKWGRAAMQTSRAARPRWAGWQCLHLVLRGTVGAKHQGLCSPRAPTCPVLSTSQPQDMSDPQNWAKPLNGTRCLWICWLHIFF